MNMNCPYCGLPCEKVEKDIWFCKNHGRVLQEVEGEDDGEIPSMIG